MSTYITTDEAGAITAQADWAFPGGVCIDCDVVRGYDGRLYKAGEESAPPAPTEEQLYAALRAARDARLAATDKYLLADYPISADALAEIKAYRAALRDLPDLPDAPWGGGEDTPWPDAPDFMQTEQPCA